MWPHQKFSFAELSKDILSKDINTKNTLTFAMDLRKSALYVIAILVVVNGMTDGNI
jgi:hypothetical protein